MKKWIILLTIFFVPDLLHGQPKDIQSEIASIMHEYSAVGMTAAVVKDGKIIYSDAFGYNPNYNDTTLRILIPDDGVFVIQSISKTFISTAIMQLVEKKKLKLDDDVNKYLPFKIQNPKYPDTPITIRMLLSHRSTINDKQYAWHFNQINPETGKRWKECYNDYLPGTKFFYSNFNYNLLGAIIEMVTGQRFFDYIDENIIEPLGLNASFNLTRIDTSKLVRAYQYDKKKKIFKKDTTPIYDSQYYETILKDYKLGLTTPCFSPSGGVKISAVDLAKYMMMHMNNGKYNGKRILKKKSELAMRRPLASDTTYALGFFRNNDILKGKSIVGVRGNAHGVHTAMYFSPEEKFGIVVFCNGCKSDRPMKDSIAWTLYKHLIKKEANK